MYIRMKTKLPQIDPALLRRYLNSADRCTIAEMYALSDYNNGRRFTRTKRAVAIVILLLAIGTTCSLNCPPPLSWVILSATCVLAVLLLALGALTLLTWELPVKRKFDAIARDVERAQAQKAQTAQSGQPAQAAS